MFKILISFLLFFIPVCGEYTYNLAICAIFQNEAPYLKEWIEFHRLMGVEHFYLYNHNSRDNCKEILQPYILSGIVELKDETAKALAPKAFNSLQCKCYTECLTRAKGISKWVAFIDLDEFLFPMKEDNLQDVLKDYEKFGGVVANWRMFGTSFIEKIPRCRLQLECFTFCSSKNFQGNRYIKSIVRPERVSHFTNPHMPVYHEDFFGVNTDKLPLETMWSDYYQTNRLCVNHYWTRDEDYFYHQKLERHKRWRGKPDPQAIKAIIDNLNKEQNIDILRFLPKLKKSMLN
jgi:hypothetical protein